MVLDLRFGVAQPPTGSIRKGEDIHRPKSLSVVGLPQAPVALPTVIAYMLSVQNGCKVTSYLCDSTTVLWIVDEAGRIRMAIEEAFRLNPFRTIPILRNNGDGSVQWSKLGHPSLVNDNPSALGRIGGELRYVDGRWELSNLSGRYGIRPCGRDATQLDNVAACLSMYGLTIETDFQ